jgi:hypothetical protein
MRMQTMMSAVETQAKLSKGGDTDETRTRALLARTPGSHPR